MTKMLTSVTFFAIAVFFGPADSYLERCVGERCFTIPGSNETRNFDDAKNWCKESSSNLAVVNDDTTQEALSEFLESVQLNEPKQSMFIDMKLVQKEKTFYLVNGTKYLGGIFDQNPDDYWFYVYILKATWIAFYAFASKPVSLRYFICEFENERCSNNYMNYLIYKDRCFVKYENETLTWYKARESCRSNGGDLATFNYDSGTTGFPNNVPFDTSWLNPSLSYWIGIRWKDWLWISSGADEESIYTRWASNNPNNINYECVCVDPNTNPAWRWIDCSCTDPRQFVCLNIVPTTTASKSASATTLSAISFRFNNVTDSISTRSANSALIVGLVLGIAVILPLLIIILILVIIIQRQRRSRESTQRSDRPSCATQMEDATTDLNYQHLQRVAKSEPGSQINPYDQLSPSENKDHELTT